MRKVIHENQTHQMSASHGIGTHSSPAVLDDTLIRAVARSSELSVGSVFETAIVDTQFGVFYLRADDTNGTTCVSGEIYTNQISVYSLVNQTVFILNAHAPMERGRRKGEKNTWACTN